MIILDFDVNHRIFDLLGSAAQSLPSLRSIDEKSIFSFFYHAVVLVFYPRVYFRNEAVVAYLENQIH